MDGVASEVLEYVANFEHIDVGKTNLGPTWSHMAGKCHCSQRQSFCSKALSDMAHVWCIQAAGTLSY